MSLGVECGATGTSILLVSENGEKLQRGEFGPANFNLLSASALRTFFEGIQHSLPDHVPVINMGVGMPGIGDAKAKEVVCDILRETWPSLKKVWVGSDAETALACIGKDSDLKVIVIAGTGSNIHAKDAESVSKIGGFGHVIGDRGSSYAVANKALRLALRDFEMKCSLGKSPDENKRLREVDHIPDEFLIKHFMAHLKIPSIAQLVQWSVSCSKTEMARLAVLVLQKWREGNLLAKEVIDEAIQLLAEDCSCLVKKFLKKPVRYSKITIGLTGSLFTKNDDFSKHFKEKVSSMLDLRGSVKLHFRKLLDTVQGALSMVTSYKPMEGELDDLDTAKRISRSEMIQHILPENGEAVSSPDVLSRTALTLDALTISDAVDLILQEESAVHAEISKHKIEIQELILEISRRFEKGGRLFYVGAGTSGRLGMMDAAEYPPSLKSPPEWIQGIIAGGNEALSRHLQGAGDSVLEGSKAVDEKEIGIKDAIIGISTNGCTPFVWGALCKAHNKGALTALLTCNPNLKFKWRPDTVITLNFDPDVISGSRRLKHGIATKSILNMLSTLATVNYSKSFENLMLHSSSAKLKLKERALWIVLLLTEDLLGVNEEKVRELLIKNKYDIQQTVQVLRSSQ